MAGVVNLETFFNLLPPWSESPRKAAFKLSLEGAPLPQFHSKDLIFWGVFCISHQSYTTEFNQNLLFIPYLYYSTIATRAHTKFLKN